MKVAVTRGANDNYNNGIISKAMMRIMIIILTLKVSSNSGTSNNWEGVVLSGWQRSENLIACHGIQRQRQMGIWHKPK